MASDEILRNVAYVKRAKNRRKVLEALQEPGLPSEIVMQIYGASSETLFSTVSRALRELESSKLAEVLNREEKTGRTYRLTSQGKAVLGFLQKEKTRVIKRDI
jgi:Fe2+ or Zn2+ uptake regulation protein